MFATHELLLLTKRLIFLNIKIKVTEKNSNTIFETPH